MNERHRNVARIRQVLCSTDTCGCIPDGAFKTTDSGAISLCCCLHLIRPHSLVCAGVHGCIHTERMLLQACEDVQDALKVKLKLSAAFMQTGRFSPNGNNVAGRPVKGIWRFGGANNQVRQFV